MAYNASNYFAPTYFAPNYFGTESGASPEPFPAVCGNDFMSRGMAWLATRQQSTMSQPIVYRRGNDVVAICATIGSTMFQISDEDGGIRMERSDRDFLIVAADLVLSGSPVKPVRGDTIKQNIGGTIFTYEVFPYNGEQPYRWSDTYRNRFRVHTKLITEV